MKMRMTRRGAGMLIALMLIAVPAAAAVMTQSFVKSNVELDNTCFNLLEGQDSLDGYATFDPSPTVTDPAGNVSLIQAEISITGNVGNRVVFTDVGRFDSSCVDTLSLRLRSASDPAGAPAQEPPVAPGSLWESVDIRIFVAAIEAMPAGSDPLNDPSSWTEVLTVVDGTVSNGGTVTLINGANRELSFVIDTDAGFAPDIDPANNTLVWRWTAEASKN